MPLGDQLVQPLVYMQRLELIRNVCREEALRSLSHTAISKFVLDRIFVCDKHRILFCQTPKVGNTQWKKVLIVLNGACSAQPWLPPLDRRVCGKGGRDLGRGRGMEEGSREEPRRGRSIPNSLPGVFLSCHTSRWAVSRCCCFQTYFRTSSLVHLCLRARSVPFLLFQVVHSFLGGQGPTLSRYPSRLRRTLSQCQGGEPCWGVWGPLRLQSLGSRNLSPLHTEHP